MENVKIGLESPLPPPPSQANAHPTIADRGLQRSKPIPRWTEYRGSLRLGLGVQSQGRVPRDCDLVSIKGMLKPLMAACPLCCRYVTSCPTNFSRNSFEDMG